LPTTTSCRQQRGVLTSPPDRNQTIVQPHSTALTSCAVTQATSDYYSNLKPTDHKLQQQPASANVDSKPDAATGCMLSLSWSLPPYHLLKHVLAAPGAHLEVVARLVILKLYVQALLYANLQCAEQRRQLQTRCRTCALQSDRKAQQPHGPMRLAVFCSWASALLPCE
jgi:hypothetical protein